MTPPDNTQAGKQIWIDVLTVISCFAVVILHTNKIFWERPQGRLWVTANIIETVFYYAVPVFFMISGYTLMDYRQRYNSKTFLQKRFRRTVIPFIAWSLFGLWLYSYKNAIPLETGWRDIVSSTLTHRYVGIYWFFIPLFAIYLSLPVISLIPQDKRQKVFAYSIACAFISYAVLPTAAKLLMLDYDKAIQAPFVGGYLLYTLLGYYLGHYDISRRIRIALYLSGIAGLCLHFFGTLYLSPPDGIDHTFKEYLNFPCVLYSAAIFVYCRYSHYHWLERNPVAIRLLHLAKTAALGVYLLHIYFVWYVPQWLGLPEQSIVFRVGGAVGIFLACVAISHIFRRIPILRALIP
ncbi:acyltransferase [Cardiobacterium valvarum]|uniref:Inner membrane protein YiaH n=1 Tax=Cardiobacterium valvarum TaxID=194702 RepID=A0A381EBD6_9GAMM|nr:acyltransferase [Cardiobacterium valvarum]SUX24272.1 Inner membrane protein YiaH [Cardiobacterium valvarum]